MKLILCLICFLLAGAQCTFFAQNFRDGDIIFIRNKDIKGKSPVPNGKSKFNYVGIIFIENNVPMVYHSMQPLSKCTVEDFVNLSENKVFERKYLGEEELLTNEIVESMHKYAASKVGTSYDNSLKLNNGSFYNAEFVWEIYQVATGIALCIPREIRDYKAENAVTSEFLTDAYGDAILSEKIVSIGDLYQSQFLD
ncbi:MAG: YiiX/YebB-like N1pC/P60 family cysteine hydrolase [Bacteroidota bacterium]